MRPVLNGLMGVDQSRRFVQACGGGRDLSLQLLGSEAHGSGEGLDSGHQVRPR